MVINWNLNLMQNRGYKENLENFKLKNCDFGMGGFLSDLLWVRSAINKNVKENICFDQKELEKTLIFLDLNEDNVQNFNETIFYEAISKTCFCLYKLSYYMSEEKQKSIPIKARKMLENCSDSDLIDAFRQVNELLNESIDNLNNETFSKLNNLIDKYSLKSLFIKQYKKEERRCVSAYKFLKEHNSLKGYISFSGFVDCDQLTLRKMGSKDTEKTDFIQYITEIADKMQMNLIRTNKEMKIYAIDYLATRKIDVFSTLGSEFGITKINYLKRKYSCCERKIFTEFDRGFHQGTLYVKFKPCEKCQLGILFEQQRGHFFNVIHHI